MPFTVYCLPCKFLAFQSVEAEMPAVLTAKTIVAIVGFLYTLWRVSYTHFTSKTSSENELNC